jgi:hypothetical protein
LQRLSFLLDNAIAIPGTSFRIGLDPLIGLVPGGGDILSAILSGYIVAEASRLGASRTILLQMATNIVLESALGTVPLLGDVFDAGWKANAKNVRLLEDHLNGLQSRSEGDRSAWLSNSDDPRFPVSDPTPTDRSHRLFTLALLVGLAIVTIALLGVTVLVLNVLLQLASNSW